MLKKCETCGRKKEMRPNQKYCSVKCRKAKEVSKRGAPKLSGKIGKKDNKALSALKKHANLNKSSLKYWNNLAPIVFERGHLNLLSLDAFCELCDLYSQLESINNLLKNNIKLLFQKNSNGDLKESTLSDLKRKYGRQILDFCKVFYLTPLSNRGNYGIDDGTELENINDRFFD